LDPGNGGGGGGNLDPGNGGGGGILDPGNGGCGGILDPWGGEGDEILEGVTSFDSDWGSGLLAIILGETIWDSFGYSIMFSDLMTVGTWSLGN